MKNYEITLGGTLNFGDDLTRWLDGDTITGVTWSISAGFSLVSATYDDTSFVLFLTPNGAVIGDVCICTATFTTTLGLTDQRTFSVEVVKYR